MPAVTIAGQVPATLTDLGGHFWEATRVMQAGDAEGQIPFTINFSDIPGNAGTQVSTTTDGSSVTFDRTAPVLAITAPLENAPVNGDELITFTGGEHNPLLSVDNINWYNFESGTATLSSLPEFSGLPEGGITLRLSDTDLAGNSSTISVNLTKDTVAPDLAITAPAADSQVNGGAVISFTGAENAPQVSLDDANWHPATSGVTTLGSLAEFATLPEGGFTLWLRDTDTAGNLGKIWISLTKDTTGPTVTVEQKFDQTDPTKNLPVLFTVWFNEPVFGFVPADLTLGGSAGPTAATITDLDEPAQNRNFQVVVTTATNDGTVTVNLAAGTVTDAAGNPNDASTSTDNTVTYDTTPPALAITAPGNGAAVNGTAVIEFTNTDSHYPEVSVNNSNWVGATSGVTQLGWIAEFANLPDEGFTLYLRDTDPAGNTGTAQVNLTKDTVAPDLAITAPAFSALVNGGTALTFTGGEGASLFSFNNDAPWNAVASGATFGAMPGFAGLTDGWFSVYLRETDAAGNLAETNQNFIKDTTPPELTFVSITSSNPDPGRAKTGDTVTVSFAANEPLQDPPLASIAGIATGPVTQLYPFDGTLWEVSKVMSAVDAEGLVAFTLNFADLLGQAGTQVTATTDGSAVVFDYTAPQVVNVSADDILTPDGTYSTGASIMVTVQFNEPVVASDELGNLNLALQLDSPVTPQNALYLYALAADTLAFEYIVQPGDMAADLDYESNAALVAGAGASIADLAGNAAVLNLPEPAQPGSLGTNRDIVIDTNQPSVLSITSTTADGSYGAGAEINITLTFSEPVTLAGGNLNLVLNSGAVVTVPPFGDDPPVDQAAAVYTVAADENADPLLVSGIYLDGGATMKDAGDNNVLLGLPAENIDDASAIRIDTSAPFDYWVVFAMTPDYVNLANQAAVAFNIINAEIGTTYNYTIAPVQGGLRTGGEEVVGSGLVTASPMPVGDIDLSELPDGELRVDITLTDAAGNQGAPAGNTIVKDTVPPAGYSVSFDQAFINLANHHNLTFTIADAEIGSEFSYNITSSGGGGAGGNGPVYTVNHQVLVDVSGLNDGTLTLDAYLTDPAGNQGSAAGDTVEKDTAAPAPVITAPADSSEVNGSAIISFTGTENNPQVSVDNGSHWTAAVSGNTTFDGIAEFADLPEGWFNLKLRSADAAGNSGETFVELIKDTAPPLLVINNPADGVTVNGSAILDYSVEGGGDNLQFSFDGTNWLALPGGILALGDLAGFAGLPDGPITLYLRDTDAVGNIGSTQEALVKDTVAPAAPAVDIPGGTYNAQQTVALTVAGDAAGTWFTLDGTEPDDEDTLYTGAFFIDAGDGASVTLRAVSYDFAGNPSAELFQTYNFDKVGPAAPTASIAGGTFNAQQNVALTPVGDAANTYYTLDGTEPDNGDTLYTGAIAIDAAHDSSVTLRAVSYDAAGNRGAELFETYSFDKIGPAAPTADIAGGTFNSQQDVTLTPAFDAVSTYYTLDGTEPDNASLPYAGGFIAIDAGDGDSVSLRVASYDTAGNRGDELAETYNFDKVGPTVLSVSSPLPDGTYSAGEEILVTVQYNEPVVVDGEFSQPFIFLDLDPSSQRAFYISGSGTDTLTFAYTVGTGFSTPDLDYTAAGALDLNGAQINDPAGNAATNTLPAPGSGGSLGANNDIVILATAEHYLAETADTLGGNESRLAAINANGEAAGMARDEGGLPRALFMDAGSRGSSEIPVPGSTWSAAYGLNAANVAVGAYLDSATGTVNAFAWPGTGNASTLAGLNNSPATVAQAVNDDGVIVGYSMNSAGQPQGIVWPDSVTAPLQLGLPGTADSAKAQAVSPGAHNSTQIRIAGEIRDNGVWRATVWQWSAGSYVHTDLHAAVAAAVGTQPRSFARGVNADGVVVGYYEDNEGQPHAAVWQSGTMSPLPGLGGGRSMALGINASGLIVGWAEDYYTSELRAVVWKENAVIDLNALRSPDALDWDLLQLAAAVNDAGQIAGHGWLWVGGDRETRGFILSPPGAAVNLRPFAQISAPTPDSNLLVANQPLQVLVEAADLDGAVAVVELFVDNASMGTDFLPPYEFFLNLPAGNYQLVAKATDDLGAFGESAPLPVVLQDNAAPVAQNDSYALGKNDRFLQVNAPGIRQNDSDADNDPLTLMLATPPANGLLDLGNDGAFFYVPNPGFAGTDSFAYRLFDGLEFSGVAVVTITVAKQEYEFQLPLLAGWNLVSIPIMPIDRLTRTVVNTTLANVMVALDAGGAAVPVKGVFEWNNLTNAYFTPADIVPKKAYWVFVDKAATVTVYGWAVANQMVPVRLGWNLIGPVMPEPYDPVVPGWLVLPQGVFRPPLLRYNQANNSYLPALMLEAGQGYWFSGRQNTNIPVGD